MWHSVFLSSPQRLMCFFQSMFFSFSKIQTLTNINQSVLMTLFLSCFADWCIKLSPMSLAGILKLRDKHLLIRQIVFRRRPSAKTSQESYFTLLGCLRFCSTRVYTSLHLFELEDSHRKPMCYFAFTVFHV